MKLKEWSYEHGESGGWVYPDYPDEIIQKFIEYFRITKRWREDPELVFQRWLVFERELTEAKNAAALEAAQDDVCTAVTKAGAPCKNTMAVIDGLCAIHRRALAAA